MGKTDSTPAKKQQSISNFFTPKTANGPARTFQSQASQNPPLSHNSSPVLGDIYNEESGEDVEVPLRPITNGTSKRALADDVKENDDDSIERPLKRAKGDENVGSTFFTDTPQRKSTAIVSNKSNVSPRTERYLYSASNQAAESILEEVEDDQSVRARKEELHKKFVKKLGNPDSLAQIRRRNWQSNDDTAALEEADGEEEEGEEDTPPPTKTKKKGAKTGKLTPLEIQVLDIKRKHMDTLLIVEMGYKFKFFGEDARTAAKELSIVCIPGKFRYDERMFKFSFVLI